MCCCPVPDMHNYTTECISILYIAMRIDHFSNLGLIFISVKTTAWIAGTYVMVRWLTVDINTPTAIEPPST